MADATRFQVMSKQIEEQKQATVSISTQIEKLTQSQAQIDKLVQSQQKMEAMMAAFMSQRSNQLSRPPDPPYLASGDLTSYSQAPQPPDPPDCKSQTEFPKFDGTLFREWFRRCDQYFSVHKTPPEMRVRVASSYMIGKALQWHTDYIRSNFGIFPPWLDYIMAISAKFGDDDAMPTQPVSFNPYYRNPYETPLSLTETIATPLSKPDFTPKRYDEIQARKTKEELCVFDEKQYTLDHQLKYKQSQIFVKGCDVASMSGDEATYKTNSVLEKETFPSSELCRRVPATQPQGNNVTQQEEVPILSLEHSQFDVTTIADAVWIAKRCESSLLQHLSATKSRAPFSPYQNCNDTGHYKREFGNYSEPGIEFDRECEEIEDDELKDKQPEEGVETWIMSENTQSLECVDDEFSVDENLIKVTAGETAIELVDESGHKVFKERNLNSLLFQEFQIVLLHLKESSDTIVPCRNLDTRVLSSHFFAGGIMLLSKMVCAFLLPLLTMNIDSRIICLDSRSTFVDDDAAALRRIVEDRFVPRMEEICLESMKQNLEFAIDRGWIEFWTNTHDFTLTNYGLKLSPSEYTKNAFILVYHLCKHSSSCLFLNTSTGSIGALLMVYDAKRLIQLDAPPVFSDLLCVKNRIRVRLTRAGVKFHLKHKWRSKFESNKLTRTWTSYSRYDSSSCVLQQEDHYVMVLFPVAGTADITIDELRSVCKLLFGIFVLNLITEQVRDWSFFGLLLQWKWHPPPRATSEFHQAHNDKPVFHL